MAIYPNITRAAYDAISAETHHVCTAASSIVHAAMSSSLCSARRACVRLHACPLQDVATR